MLVTILYSLWILYTVGSLSVISFFVILSLIAKHENKKWRKALNERLSGEYKDEGW